MKFLKNFDWSAKSIAKVIGIVLLGLVALAIAISLISFSARTVLNQGIPSYKQLVQGIGGGVAYDYATEEAYYGDSVAASRGFAQMPIMPPQPGYSTGTDAEEYEVKSYSGSIETRRLDKTCDTIAQLKSRDYVIFEDSNKNDDNCYYRFKVEKDKADEIVAIIEKLDPKVWNVNVQSIKAQVEGIEDELEILKKKLASVEETLEGAQDAYDEIQRLATNQRDAETLAKIIDSKLNLIERLTNQRLQVKEQIDRYNEARSDQLDRLNFTFFDVSVYKNLIFDWKDIKDSWKLQAQTMVRNINEVFQSISLGLVAFLFTIVQVVLYLFISVFLLKFVWIGVKKIWKGELRRK